MRILVEPGCYDCLNMGDVAMLQVTVDRICQLWPNATTQVLTDVPERLLAYCPKAEPIPALGRHIWFQDGGLVSPFNSILPATLTLPLLDVERRTRRRYPSPFERFLQFKKRMLGQDPKSLKRFLRAISEADLIVISGQGSINDIFHAHAMNLLDVLGMAIRGGTPTALFGQGFGPLSNRRLRARVAEVLPVVTVLAVRESRTALPLLDSLGIDQSSVIVTGDDAIELAYNERPSEPGNAIGVNVRVSTYSQVDDNLLKSVGSVLRCVARRHEAPLVPVPIAIQLESDLRFIRQLVDLQQEPLNGEATLDTPLRVMRQVAHCRIVVAGSYHAAVFAMAQGIPTVCLANSEYYKDKFMGLAEQFGTGCKVMIGDAQIRDKLESALEDSWQLAEHTRPTLLDAAVKQIEASRTAYRNLYQQVSLKPDRAVCHTEGKL